MVPTQKSASGDKRGEPTVAVLLTWFLPGAGHLYLGRVGFGIAALVVVEGLYWLGIHFSGGMFLEYLPPEMRTRFAGALTPEAGNLGALLWHIREYGYGIGQPRPWPATMDIGTTLTSFSGVLNVFLMSRAHADARSAKSEPMPALGPAGFALLGWLIPGLGLIAQGRKLRGVIVFVLLVGLFVLGCVLAEGANLDRERHFYYWAGQFLIGLPAVVAEFVHGHVRVTEEIAYADAGVVLACVAGMLNVLTVLDTYGYADVKPDAQAAEAQPV